MSQITRIQIRRDTFSNWSSANPVLAAGELSIDLTNNVMRVGDGTTAWLSLPELHLDGQYGPSAYDLAVTEEGFTGSVNDWLDSLGGADGREVEFQVSATHIQWRYVGDPTWTNLISLAAIEGADGTNGVDGTDGREVELQATATHLEYRYVGDATWTQLLALSTLEGADGADGTNGTDGADGRETEFQVTATHIQWRYVGDVAWTDLIALADLQGPQGDPGAGVPVGGTAGQALTKVSATDYATEWSDVVSSPTITSIEEVTQAEYDALTPVASTMYVITDGA